MGKVLASLWLVLIRNLDFLVGLAVKVLVVLCYHNSTYTFHEEQQ